jgi:hypothetical protein
MRRGAGGGYARRTIAPTGTLKATTGCPGSYLGMSTVAIL